MIEHIFKEYKSERGKEVRKEWMTANSERRNGYCRKGELS